MDVYTLSSGGIELEAMTYGGIITALRVPDRQGRLGNVVLGHESLDAYLPNPAYLGAIVGRCANRIARGRFELDGRAYQLATNDGPHHLHGGIKGFDQHVWKATAFAAPGRAGVTFARMSPAGEEHYPGMLNVSVTYLVTSDSVVMTYEGSTDAATILNLTQHSYFNLGGETSMSVLDHELTIHADHYTPVDTTLIPTGTLASVDGTPFDFRIPARLRARLQLEHEQLRVAGGFDHNFVLRAAGSNATPAAELYDPASGRCLEVATTEPGLQCYDGHLLDGRPIGAYDRVFRPHAGLCLETQRFPDSPNQPSFPPVTLYPGEHYRSVTTWRFSIR